jgi:hypothetical protein
VNKRLRRSITGGGVGLVSWADGMKKLSRVFDVTQAPDRQSRTGMFLLNNCAVEITLKVLISG